MTESMDFSGVVAAAQRHTRILREAFEASELDHEVAYESYRSSLQPELERLFPLSKKGFEDLQLIGSAIVMFLGDPRWRAFADAEAAETWRERRDRPKAASRAGVELVRQGKVIVDGDVVPISSATDDQVNDFAEEIARLHGRAWDLPLAEARIQISMLISPQIFGGLFGGI